MSRAQNLRDAAFSEDLRDAALGEDLRDAALGVAPSRAARTRNERSE